MNNPSFPSLQIDAALRERLDALAKRRGSSLADLASDVLQRYVDEAETRLREFSADDARWERYVETGAIVPSSTVRARLATMVADPTQKPDV